MRPAVSVEFMPPVAPHLSPAEVDAAIASGGVVGVIREAVSRISPGLDLRSINFLNRLGSGPLVASAGHCLDQYRNGAGGPDHADILAEIGRLALAAEVLHNALDAVGCWIADNPGEVVSNPFHTSGRQRVFPAPEPEP